MQVVIRNKFFTIGGSSEIKDIVGNVIYKVKGRIFSFTRKKFLQDLEGNTLYTIRNKFWHFFMKRAFIYDKDKNLVCQVKRKFHIKSKFRILRTEQNYEIDGTIFGWNFQILKDGVVWATVSRNFAFTDCFTLTAPDNDILFAISMVIAMDNIIDREQGSNT